MHYSLSIQSFSIKNINKFYKKLIFFFNKKLFIKSFLFYNKNLFSIKIFYLPNKIKKYTLNKSPHIYKKSREQFETRIYKVIIIITPLVHFKKKSFLILYFFLINFIRFEILTSLIKFKLNLKI
jgi:Ribosomal protein S10p/S20e